MATRKGGTTPQIDDDFLKNIRAIKGDTPQDPQPLQDRKRGTPSPVAPKSEKVKITLLVNKAVRKEWQQFCLNNDITLTDGIQIAMNHIIDEVENHNAKISKGGFRK